MYNFTNDRIYARDVCEGSKLAREKFILQITDQALWTAKKFHGKDNIDEVIFNDSSSESNLQTGKKIVTNDEILDTWMWILKKMTKYSCKYKGEAKFMTYIFSTMNHQYTKNDWLKKKYGDTAYIPNIIKNLSSNHQKIYTLLKRKTNCETIANKMNIELTKAEYIVHEIKFLLFNHGKGNTLGEKQIRFKETIIDGEKIDLSEMEDIKSIDPSILVDFEKIYDILVKCFENLDKSDRRLLSLYWHKGLSVSKIVKYIQEEDILDDFIDINIDDDRSFNKYLSDLMKHCRKWIEDNYNDLYKSYDLNESKIKNGIKGLLQNFDI